MKISEITAQDVFDYLKLDDDEDNTKREINCMLEAAKSYVKSYTGLTEQELDNHNEFYIVIMVLCQDMFDTRSYYVDTGNVNKVVESILGMHCMNLLA